MSNQTERRTTRDQLVTIGDLEQLKTDLAEIMKQLFKPGKSIPQKPWLKSHEVRELLGISNGKLLTLRSNGTLPFTRIGNVIYYKAEDIQELFNKRETRLP